MTPYGGRWHLQPDSDSTQGKALSSEYQHVNFALGKMGVLIEKAGIPNLVLFFDSTRADKEASGWIVCRGLSWFHSRKFLEGEQCPVGKARPRRTEPRIGSLNSAVLTVNL